MNCTYEDLEHMTVEELKTCLEWAKEETENGNDYRA